MVKRKRQPFIDDIKARKVCKELAMRKVEDDIPLGNNNNPTWLRAFNAEMRTMHPDFNKFLESSL